MGRSEVSAMRGKEKRVLSLCFYFDIKDCEKYYCLGWHCSRDQCQFEENIVSVNGDSYGGSSVTGHSWHICLPRTLPLFLG